MVDRIPSKYGVLIVQKWKHFVAIPIVGCRVALAVMIHALDFFFVCVLFIKFGGRVMP